MECYTYKIYQISTGCIGEEEFLIEFLSCKKKVERLLDKKPG
jgi:hypothetical protein